MDVREMLLVFLRLRNILLRSHLAELALVSYLAPGGHLAVDLKTWSVAEFALTSVKDSLKVIAARTSFYLKGMSQLRILFPISGHPDD